MRTVYTRQDRPGLRTLIVPGLGGSGPRHWQSLWQEVHPEYERVVPPDWSEPDLERWTRAVAAQVAVHSGQALPVAHGFGCLAAVRAHALSPERFAGGMLVAPVDPEALAVDAMLARCRLGENWIVVASRNDPRLSFERARTWAARWACEFVDPGHAGTIDARSGAGEWLHGMRLLAQLRRRLAPQGRAAPLAPLAA